jgi:hypothetical protein
MVEPLFRIFKSRIIYGGMPGDWRLIKETQNLDDVNDFLELENLIPMIGGSLWGTESDSMGCSDVYRIEVALIRS